jgi:SPP1 family predicted phage head-tail adaptor
MHRLDRLIQIQRATSAPNEFNEPAETWNVLATVYAKRTDASAGERYRAQEVGAQITTRFVIRYSTQVADVNPKDRVEDDRRTYNITGVREVKDTRNRWLEIDAVSRAEASS